MCRDIVWLITASPSLAPSRGEPTPPSKQNSAIPLRRASGGRHRSAAIDLSSIVICLASNRATDVLISGITNTSLSSK